MLRATVLSLLILISAAVLLPWGETAAQGENRVAAGQSERRQIRRHSRAWLRRRRALLRRRRAVAAMRRQRGAALARERSEQPRRPERAAARRMENAALPRSAAALVSASGLLQDPRGQWQATLPRTWINAQASASELRFNLRTPDGSPAGLALFAPIASSARAAQAAPPARRNAMSRMMGGAPLASLRQLVIERMIAAGGWVVNDMERTVGGRRVFAVVAQTGTGGVARETWMFYFTVVDGRLYALTTVAPVSSAALVAVDAEQVLASLRETPGRTLAGTQAR